MRTVGIVTVARSDYGIYLPLLRTIQNDPDLDLHLFVSGMHLSPEFGKTVEHIKKDGFYSYERIEMLLSSDTPDGVAKSMGLGIIGFSQAYARNQPDILLVLGDRFEMHSAALAALPFKIPVAHIHGGELTRGAIDDALRHSITKLSHLHFASAQEYANRIIQMGEEPWRVVVSGALSLDNIANIQLLNKQEFFSRYELLLEKDFLLVTYHPVSLEFEQAEWQVKELLKALETIGMPILFTMPNADTGGRPIVQLIAGFVEDHPGSRFVRNLGTRDYFSAMALAGAMVGNSSSGIIEASSFALPVVNIGTRQAGRMRGKNVIDTGYNHSGIVSAIRNAISPEFKQMLKDMSNPYGEGKAAQLILMHIKSVDINERLLTKHFHTI